MRTRTRNSRQSRGRSAPRRSSASRKLSFVSFLAMGLKMPPWVRLAIAIAGATGITSKLVQTKSVRKVLSAVEKLMTLVSQELERADRRERALHVNRRGRLVHA